MAVICGAGKSPGVVEYFTTAMGQLGLPEVPFTTMSPVWFPTLTLFRGGFALPGWDSIPGIFGDQFAFNRIMVVR
ncbi:hypothetical protein ZHAS_00020002 [Anopheles sinensis]|uniref:Uncharacterized protein n=1 Tax=Anopheles sinensis TaxID=74873 RepID=A0A084WNL7_ANOSI|nr:hypothetical protein ZHAS_00020002 [Anopheles sinensis]